MTDTIRNERLTALAEFFEAGAPHFEFDISSGFCFKGGTLNEAIDGHCQTSGCIAGFAFMQSMIQTPEHQRLGIETEPADFGDLAEVDWGFVAHEARQYLKLAPSEANDLFEGYPRDILKEEITAEMAARAIRSVMEGRPAWSQL